MADPARVALAQLLAAIQLYTGQNPAAQNTPPAELVGQLMDAMAAAAAQLATPEPAAGPEDEEIMELMPQQMHVDLAAAARALAEQAGTDNQRATGIMRIMLNRHAVDLARAVLARYGHQPPQPIPLPERQPGPEDCDAEGRCWYWNPDEDNEHWDFMPRCSGATVTWTHWLPHHALPLPEVEP